MEKIDYHFLNIYLNRFLGDMVPIVPLLGLLLLSHPFNLSDISLFFLCLSITVIVVEIPAGLIADSKNPRMVVIASRIFKLLAFVCLYYTINLYLLCLAAILWGISSALDSGAMQSYLYRLTQQRGRLDQFEQIYGKTFTAALIGLLVAGLIASQITMLGFSVLQYVGIASLLICVVSAAFFPKLAPVETGVVLDDDKKSLVVALSSFLKLGAPLIILLCIGIFAGGIKGSLDEYTTLLLVDKELSFSVIGYIVFGLEVLRTGGAAVASRFKLPIKAQILILGVLGLAFLAAAIGNYIVAILALVTVIFIDAVLWVHNDTAIQRRASEGNRATVASVKNFGTEVLAAIIFLVTWVFGEKWDTSMLYLAGGSVLIVASTIISLKYKKYF